VQLESERRFVRLATNQYDKNINNLADEIKWLRQHVGILMQHSDTRAKEIIKVNHYYLEYVRSSTNAFQKTIYNLIIDKNSIKKELNTLAQKIDFENDNPSKDEIELAISALKSIQQKESGAIETIVDSLTGFGIGIGSSIWANIILSLLK
jgi:hypothetical protein